VIVGTPNGGLDEIGESAYKNHAQYSLVAYTNARDSLGLSTLVINLVQPTVANGYAPILLNGSWTSISGDVTYLHSIVNPNTGFRRPYWQATGAWSAAVRGVALIFGARVIHFADIYVTGVPTDFVPVNGSWLEVDLLTVV
jgi:hypothetical protein